MDFNVDKANAHLDGAGWKRGADGIREKNGRKMRLVYQTSVNSVRQKVQGIFKQACDKAGIELELKAVTPAVFFSSDAYFSPSWTVVLGDRGRCFGGTWTLFQADRGRRFSLNVDDWRKARVILTPGMLAGFAGPPCPPPGSRCVRYDRPCACTLKPG